MKGYKEADRTNVLGIDGKTLGDRLKAVRKALELDQTWFAKSIVVKQISDSMAYIPLEQGRLNKPKENSHDRWYGISEKDALEVILKLNEVYNVSIVWLLRGRGAMFGADEAMVYAQKERILAEMVKYDKKVGELVNLL